MSPASKVTSVLINRAPVMTLWAAVVAERLGFSRDEALTLGKAVAGLNAQTKGRRLGIYDKPTGKPAAAAKRPPARAPGEKVEAVELMHRAVTALRTPQGLRALHDGKPISPESVERYLESKFKDSLDAARGAMESLAASLDPGEIAASDFELYEKIRPAIPPGKRGWGAAGVLDLELIRSIARSGTRRPET